MPAAGWSTTVSSVSGELTQAILRISADNATGIRTPAPRTGSRTPCGGTAPYSRT
ncbi:hypothetical protein NWFMUON74_15750 [Nocardia wallacei]|uniref:Uncharacterized protein n=1 Tax=Nocardia wallacei TaxID=480035 RepID=A0A7G1KI21_9NOCA|nr:hypothetical protein NWFMUON74_15750 [Nocardia wallacei]